MFHFDHAPQEIVASISKKTEEHLLWHGIAQTGCKPGSLSRTQSGDLLAVWYGGGEFTGDESEETVLWFAKYSEGSWTKPTCLYKESGYHIWNPVFFSMPDGKLLLYFRKFAPTVPEPQKEKYGVRNFTYHVMSSYDNGESWSAPDRLADGVLPPSKSSPLITGDGTWIFPCAESGSAYLQISDDEGKSWKRLLIGKELTEPTLVQAKDGTVHIFLRNRQRDATDRFIMHATFNPETSELSQPKPTSMPNPDSGIDVIRLEDGTLALAANPSHTSRSTIALYRSCDEGISWSLICTLENGVGDFAQPSLQQSANGNIEILYYYWPLDLPVKNIKHVSVQAY